MYQKILLNVTEDYLDKVLELCIDSASILNTMKTYSF